MANFNGMAALETPEFMVSKMDEFGTPESYNHYAVGWAWAMNTPVPVDEAGRLALGRHPQRHDRALAEAGSTEKGGLRSQFTHVIDVAPTILEAAGLPEPTMVNGVQQSPMEGTSMLYTFDEPEAPGRHDLQYFEMFGNRGIYHKGWSAVTKHTHPVGHGGRHAAGIRRRRLGALRRQQRLQPGATTSSPSIRRCSPSCNGCG